MKIRSKNVKLIDAMDKAGHNSKTLCSKVNLHTNTMSLILNTRRVPSKRTAKIIAKELNVSIRSLFPEVYDGGKLESSK